MVSAIDPVSAWDCGPEDSPDDGRYNPRHAWNRNRGAAAHFDPCLCGLTAGTIVYNDVAIDSTGAVPDERPGSYAVKISSKDLTYGDVLITAASNLVSHCGIVAGTREVKTSGGLYAPTVNRTDMIVHATSGGILTEDSQKWITKRGATDVFRFRSMRFTSLGGKGAAESVAAAAVKLAAKCCYGKGRAYFKSWTGTSTYGENAEARLKKYLSRLGAGDKHLISLYCSELVVLSYQIAAQGDTNVPFFIDLDGKHTLPKDLRNWFLQRVNTGGSWQVMGELEG